jgi:hypothetical protein
VTSSSNVVVTFGNAAALVINHLRPLIAPLPIRHDVPNPRPTPFIRIVRTGGPRSGVIDTAQLTIESWAADADVAEANAQTVRKLVNDLVGQTLNGHPVYRVDELSGPAELPDPFSDSRRSTWTVQVWIRGL